MKLALSLATAGILASTLAYGASRAIADRLAGRPWADARPSAPEVRTAEPALLLSGGSPRIQAPELPEPDLGFPLRRRGARQSVGDAIKGACLVGAGIGYSIGQTVGLEAGRVEGVIIGCTATSSAWAGAVFIAYLFLRASRK